MGLPKGHRREPPRGLLAEAAVASRLLERGFAFAHEVAIPKGSPADFEVELHGVRMSLQVKHFSPELPPAPRPPFPLRSLERVRRPVVLGLWWSPSARAKDLAAFARVSTQFALEASPGEECAVRGPGGAERVPGGAPRGGGAGVIARCRILGTWDGAHAVIAVGADADPAPLVPRIARLLERAHAQCRPKRANAILILSPGATVRAVDIAVLGRPIERWDALPRRGERVAIGRDGSGFLDPSLRGRCDIVLWLPFEAAGDPGAPGRIWLRTPDAASPAELAALETLAAATPRRGVASP